MAPKTESLMATEPEPQASVPENCQVVPEGFWKARGGQRPPEEALCTRLLKKGAGQDTTWSGGKRPGLRWIYSPRGLQSVLGQAKGRGEGARNDAGQRGEPAESASGAETVTGLGGSSGIFSPLAGLSLAEVS